MQVSRFFLLEGGEAAGAHLHFCLLPPPGLWMRGAEQRRKGEQRVEREGHRGPLFFFFQVTTSIGWGSWAPARPHRVPRAWGQG